VKHFLLSVLAVASTLFLSSCGEVDEETPFFPPSRDAAVIADVSRPIGMDSTPMNNCPTGEPMAGEMCNGKDDDCDGFVDEGFNNCNGPERCQNGETRDCRTDCGSGIQRCSLGIWDPCIIMEPVLESCNGLDDDCDHVVDEDTCREDLGLAMDAGLEQDMEFDSTLPEDMSLPEPDMFIDPNACMTPLDCDPSDFCYRDRCFHGLPGTYRFTFLSARFDPDEVQDPFLHGPPELFAVLTVDNEEAGRTATIEGEQAVNWPVLPMDVFLERNSTINICVYDDDNFLSGSDDEVGCLENIRAHHIVEQIRNYDEPRPGTRILWALIMPDVRGTHLTELRLTIERLVDD